MKEYASYDGLGLADLVKRKQVSASELADDAIATIERLNPKLNAVVHRFFDQARAVARTPIAGPFEGVPFLVKDLLATLEGLPITHGSRLYRGYVAPRDTEQVARYRRAGLVILGRTASPEFGLTPFTEPELYGPCRNPWNLDHTVGGSSGGSAAAVASGMVPIASGGDGGGSLRIPASCCGIFGLKPTRGRVPTGPDNGELWQGATVEHCLTRSVRDSAAMLDAVAGPDIGAPYFAVPPTRPYLDEVSTPPGRLRIAISDDPILGHSVHPDCRAALTDAGKLLESLGHEVVPFSVTLDREKFNRCFVTMLVSEVQADLQEAAEVLGRKATRNDVEYVTWALGMLGTEVRAGEYAASLRYLQRVARDVMRSLQPFDVFATPTLAMPPIRHGELQPPPSKRRLLQTMGALRAGKVIHLMGAIEEIAATVFDFAAYTPLFNVTGQPGMSVPLYRNGAGLPIGTQFVARYGDEPTLFRLAAQLEAARPWPRPPAVA